MAKKIAPLEYYSAASGGIHTFMMCATEYLVSRLVVEHGAKIHYYAFLTGSFDEESIDDVTALLGGTELDMIQEGFPLAGLNAAKDKVSGSKVSIVQGAKDAIWEFKKVTKHPSYLGVVNAFNYDYGRRPSLMACPFVVAYDMEEAVVLITCLREAVRVHNRKTKRVLDTNGMRIDNFRKMSWDKIFLPGDMLKDIQQEVKSFFESKEMYESHGLDWRRGMLFVGPPGNGKCLRANTPILMFDGTIKMVQDVVVGDSVMGPDSKPRIVRSLGRGREMMYEVKPTKGESYYVNESHILSLKASGGFRIKKGTIVNIGVNEYLNMDVDFKHHMKGWRTAVDFEPKTVMIDPYMLGYWLGDGNSDSSAITTMDQEVVSYFDELTAGLKRRTERRPVLSLNRLSKAQTYHYSGRKRGKNWLQDALRKYGVINNKHVPFEYKANTRDVRLQLLAGLMDSDGSWNYEGFDFVSKSETLADDVLFLSRSLGFAAYKKKTFKRATNSRTRTLSPYWRVIISGDLSEVPVKLGRKMCSRRKQIKDVLVTGIKVVPVGVENYFGFEIEGPDKLFVMGDFTVTHNTAVARAIATTSDVPVVYCLLSDGDPYGMLSSAHTTIVRNSPCIAIFEDADSFGADATVRSSMLNMLDGLVSSSGVLTIASTNCPDKLDSAITGRPSRFDSLYVFENPGQSERVRLLSDRLGKDAKRLSKEIADVSRKSSGLSSAAIQEIAVCALLSSMKGKRGVSASDLAGALAKVKKHMQCSKDGMDKYSRGSIGFSVETNKYPFPSSEHGILGED